MSDYSFSAVASRLASRPKRVSVAIVCPHDSHTLYVVERALNEGIARFQLYVTDDMCQRLSLLEANNPQWVKICRCADSEDASAKAVADVRNGDADVLMKGKVNTDVLLHAVLDKQCGLLRPGAVLSHVTVAEIPSFGRHVIFSDAAVVPEPTLEQFHSIVGYCADACRRMGIVRPHLALIHCAETVNPKFPHTVSYEEIKRRAADGAYGNAVVDGPMDVKTALEAESGDIKGICSPVAGKANVLVFPNIQAGNTFYKTLTLFADATVAAWLLGTEVPVVVTSRADSELSKYYSLVMACLQTVEPANEKH